MRVSVHRDVCVGSGSCAVTAPGVFFQDDRDGLVALHTDAPGPEERDAVRLARKRCPVGAIVLAEDDVPPGNS